MAIADDRQRFMPLPEDRLRHRGKPLDFPEAVLLVNPKEPEFKGEVLLLLMTLLCLTHNFLFLYNEIHYFKLLY